MQKYNGTNHIRTLNFYFRIKTYIFFQTQRVLINKRKEFVFFFCFLFNVKIYIANKGSNCIRKFYFRIFIQNSSIFFRIFDEHVLI